MRGNQVILVLRFLDTSTSSIYTNVQNEQNKLGVGASVVPVTDFDGIIVPPITIHGDLDQIA